MPHSEEQHSFQFRGTFVPAKVFQLLFDKEITADDAHLLIVVDGYTKCTDKEASKLVHRNIKRVSKSIAKLQKLRLLRVTYDIDGTRHLETTYYS